jgi:hypothetical protein
MKSFNFLFIALTAFIISAKAQTSSVVVFSQDGEKFWLIINGIRQNDKPETNVRVNGLESPNYRMKVIFTDEKIPAIDQNLYTRGGENFDKPMDLSYVIRKNNKGKYVLRGNSWEEAKADPVANTNQSVINFHTSENPKSEETSTPTINTTQTVTTQNKTTTTNTTTPQNNGNVGVNVNMGTNGINMNVNIQDPNFQENTNIGVNTNITTTTTTTTTTSQNPAATRQPAAQPANNNNTATAAPASKVCSKPMAASDFTNAKSSIEKQSFSDSRMKTAQQVTRNNCLSTSQVREIIQLFSFENDKLNFAKFAYDFTTDKNNYYMVNDEFKFSSSVDDLNDFLEKK